MDFKNIDNNKLRSMSKDQLMDFVFNNLPLIYHGGLSIDDSKQCSYRCMQALVIASGENIEDYEYYNDVH